MTSTSPLGSPVDHARQKQLIEELRARIQELEKTLDTLRTEREVLEVRFFLKKTTFLFSFLVYQN